VTGDNERYGRPKKVPSDASVPASIVRRRGSAPERVRDLLAAEEPLEIRLREEESAAERFVVTMRTPGDDEDLAIGLLFGEGVIRSIDEVVSVERPSDPRIDPELARNVAVVTLTKDPARAARTPRRSTVMGSACGVCGRTTIEEVVGLAARCREGAMSTARAGMDVRISPSVLTALPERLRVRQSGFAATGGLHAAGLFDAGGTLLFAREDVGRHNATDKVIGALLRAGSPPPPVLLVSGRLGFEIAQKAALAGILIVAAVSAPTSLAVDLADEARITLIGFLRGETYNIYTHPGRIG
jgi:FdhD protein